MTLQSKGEAESHLDENVRNQRASWQKLDAEQVRAFLLRQPQNRSVTDFSFHYPDGEGISNGIGFVSALIDEGDGPKQCELVVRYAPGTSLLRQKSFAEEFQTLQVVHREGLPAPRPLYLDESGAELGAPGYVMERVRGETPSAGMFARGLLAEVTPDLRHELLLEGVRFHGRLRRSAIGADKAPHLQDRGQGATCFEREANWWHFEGHANLAGDRERQEHVDQARDWLVSHQPRVRPPTLVHGDSQYANLIYRDGKVIAGIDWELSFLGHGEIDLALMILMTHMQGGSTVSGIPDRATFMSVFEEESGAPVEAFDYFDAFLHYRLMCVLPASRASMPHFEAFWNAVNDGFLTLTR